MASAAFLGINDRASPFPPFVTPDLIRGPAFLHSQSKAAGSRIASNMMGMRP